MIKVLFVCLGNICRSPMAEGIFNAKIKGLGLEKSIKSDSAGTSDYHIGELPDERILFQARLDVLHQEKMKGLLHIKNNQMYKYVHSGAKRFSLQDSKEELYDLNTDAAEAYNLIPVIDPDTLSFYRNTLTEHFPD